MSALPSWEHSSPLSVLEPSATDPTPVIDSQLTDATPPSEAWQRPSGQRDDPTLGMTLAAKLLTFYNAK
jgi:hypothetical protein